MVTFTWQPTSGTKAWETTGAAGWGGTPDFTTDPSVTDFVVGGTTALTINQISVDPVIDVARTLTVNNPNAHLVLSPLVNVTNVAVNFRVNAALVMNAGTIDLGDGPSVLSIGAGGSLVLGAGAVLTTGASATSDVGIDTVGPATITGTGTIIAANGNFNIGPGITIAGGVGNNIQFQIKNNATIEIEDSILGGTFTFANANGGAQLSLLGALPGGVFPAKISGLEANGGHNDLLLPTKVTTAAITNATAAGANLVINNTTTFTLVGNYSAAATTSITGTAVTGFHVFVTCFVAGTSILTGHGEAAVESIGPGDMVMTMAGTLLMPRVVTWVGERRIDLTRHPRPETAAPVRFQVGALGENLPRRDLLVSPDHCLFIDGALIPAKLLINGMTITQDMSAGVVSYHHVELEEHAILIAEDVAAESYLDTGNRAYFDNAGLAMRLHPEFGVNEHLRCWEQDACAPLMVQPDFVRPVWDRFAIRAKTLGFTPPVHHTTADADIHLLVDGKRFNAVEAIGGTLSFVIPCGAGRVRLVSRSTAPARLTPWLDDPRVLGVAIRAIAWRDGAVETVIGADHSGLRDGWHDAERSPEDGVWRWTNGDAALPIPERASHQITIMLSETTLYVVEASERLAA